MIAQNSIIVQHPNCIAHLHTPPLLSGIMSDVFISTLNQSMDSWDQASAATFVEKKVIDWLADIYGLGSQADGVFTSGGTQSNLMGLLLARDWAVDTLSGHNVQKNGLPEYARNLRILCSRNSHFTVQKSASLMGLGENAVECIETNADGTINLSALDAAISNLKQQGLIPFAVVGTAGTTDHGAIDDLAALREVATENKLWLHVDAAYGGALILSRHKARLDGIQLADSMSVDFHKLFYQPISCSAIMLRNKENFRFLLHHADYLNREGDALPNLVDKSIATTRSFDALKMFMTMQVVGTDTLGAMYDHLLAQTLQVSEMIDQSDVFELLAHPSLSTVLFRYKVSSGENIDAINQQIRLDALTKGVAVLGETVIEGNVALKLTILNPCLKLSDFKSLLEDVAQLASRLQNKGNS